MKNDDFMTIGMRKLICGNKIPIDSEYNGFYESFDKLMLFTPDLIQDFCGSYYCSMMMVSDEQLNHLKKVGYQYRRKSKKTTFIYKIDEDFFNTKGRRFKNIRTGLNRYLTDISVFDHPIRKEDVKMLIRLWNIQRRKYYYRLFTSTQVFFMENHFDPETYIGSFFYDGDRLIGFSVYEKVKTGYYNSLIRKNDMNYTHLSEFIDYISLKRLYNKVGNHFFNIGDDGGRKKLRDFKTKHFRVFKEFPLYSIDIISSYNGNYNNKRAKDNYVNYFSKCKQDYKKCGWDTKKDMMAGFKISEKLVNFERIESWLDLGCGTGNFFEYILVNFTNIKYCHGIDACQKSCDMTLNKLKKYPNVKATVSNFDLYQIDNSLGKFDLITLSGVLQILDIDKHETLLKKLSMLLNNNGILLINTTNIEHFGERRTNGIWTYSKDEIKSKFKNTGFKKIKSCFYNNNAEEIKSVDAPYISICGRKIESSI